MQTLRTYIAAYPRKATQRDWAKFFGISQAYFSQIMSGARFPSPRLMQRIEDRTRGEVPIAVWFKTLNTTSYAKTEECDASAP